MKMKMSFLKNCSSSLGVAVLLVIGGLLIPTNGQQTRTTGPTKRASYKLVVKDGPLISLSAKDAKLADVAAELAKKLNTKVFVSPILQDQPIKVDFKDLSLEPAMQLLAPQVFIDYELGADQQSAVGIFLYAYNEPPPSLNAVVTSASQALLVEGDTEDGVEPTTEEARKKEEEKPLRVAFFDNKLTVRARQQPVLLVVTKVGNELGIPVEIKDESRDIININLVAVPVEEGLQRISPNLRIYVRADLQRLERRPFRLVLNPPVAQSTSNAN